MVAEASQQFAQRNQAHHIFAFFDDHELIILPSIIATASAVGASGVTENKMPPTDWRALSLSNSATVMDMNGLNE